MRSRPDAPVSITARLAAAALDQRRRQHRALRRCRKECTEESVHDLRVETRRLLVYLELLGPLMPSDSHRRARRALKKVLKATASLRDTQVQLKRVKKMLRTDPDWRLFHEHLLSRQRHQAPRTLRKLKTRRLARRFAGAARALRQVATTPGSGDGEGRRLVALALERNLARVVLAIRSRSVDPDHLHQVRLALKRLRYITECLQSMGLRAPVGGVGRLRAGQAVLGDIHDAALIRSRLEKFESRRGPKSGGRLVGSDRLARSHDRLAESCQRFMAEFSRVGGKRLRQIRKRAAGPGRHRSISAA